MNAADVVCVDCGAPAVRAGFCATCITDYAPPATVHTIEFPQPTELLNMNDRNPWYVERRRARAWRSAVYLYAIQQIRPPRACGPSLVELTLPVVDRRRRDPHNFAPTLKHAVDGLVDAGLWPDDTPEWVRTLEPTLDVRRDRLVSITITPRSTT